MDERSRWNALWSRMGGDGSSEELFGELMHAYTQPFRFYHNIDHIKDCLAEFDSVRESAVRPDELEMAIWFHDSVYQLPGTLNEEKSAKWARRALGEGLVEPARIDRVAEMVLATRHLSTPEDLDTQLLVDIDLSILGRKPAVFAKYEETIRQEYRWVPSVIYNRKRADVLDGFLRRDRIYLTAPFHDKYEQPARENIKQSIARHGG